MRFEFLKPFEIERLRPLWLGVHAHNQISAPQLAPFLVAEASWQARREIYDQLVNAGGAVVVAQEDGADIGYAAWRDDRMPWPAAFDLAPRLAEIVSLGVRADKRRQGVGAVLLGALNTSITDHGFVERFVSLLPDNVQAIDMFSRRGFVPAWLILSCFARELKLPEMVTAVAVEPVSIDEVEPLKPIWVSVHHQHRAVAPHLAPYVSDDESWRVYSRTFRESAGQGLLFRVGSAEKPLAMGCASILDDITRFSDTWQTSGRVAEIEVLAALPSVRGQGFGTALMRALSERLGEIGIPDMIIGGVESNRQAVQLYEKWDFRPACLQMTKRQPAVI